MHTSTRHCMHAHNMNTITDIDECNDTTYVCRGTTSNCINYEPGWSCDCGDGYRQNNITENIRQCIGMYDLILYLPQSSNICKFVYSYKYLRMGDYRYHELRPLISYFPCHWVVPVDFPNTCPMKIVRICYRIIA